MGHTVSGSYVVSAPQTRGFRFILQVCLDRLVPRCPQKLLEGRVVETWSQVGALCALALAVILSSFLPCPKVDWGCSVLIYCRGQQRHLNTVL